MSPFAFKFGLAINAAAAARDRPAPGLGDLLAALLAKQGLGVRGWGLVQSRTPSPQSPVSERQLKEKLVIRLGVVYLVGHRGA